MNTKVISSGDVTIVGISGKISYESVDPFRDSCLKNLRQEKLVFNLKGLSFVGSTGITQFVQTIGELFKRNTSGVKLCAVSPEFHKVLLSEGFPQMEIYEDQNLALRSFYLKEEPLPPQS